MSMKMSSKIPNVKQTLATRKEQILNELKYYERRIEDAHKLNKRNTYFFDDDSSDSDIEPAISDGTSKLRHQERELQKCLEATQELTGVHILESQINIMVDALFFEGESPVVEEGLWREVTAECRLDLISFSLSFYTHSPERPFAPTSYHGLELVVVKNIHQKELSRSVLPNLTAPSDAIEVIRSYALAHRSRRTTLAALAEKFGDCLFMEPLSEGGYVMKCANLLQVSWTLQNKWSPVAPFQHKMSFDLEYLDESYIKKIANVHKKLSDPSIETDERTQYLTTIIETCLEAHKNVGPEANIESDVESQNSKKLPTSDQESDNPNRETEIMGPPKSLPKKVKPKNKENIRKRDCDFDDGGGDKRSKIDSSNNSNSNYERILKSKNNNKDKFFKNDERNTNVIRNSNKLKEYMPQKEMETVKSNSKKTINMKSNSRSTIIRQVSEAESNKVQKKSSENSPDHTTNVKNSVKATTQNKNNADKQLNAEEIDLNYNSKRSNNSNDIITNVVTERNSKKIEKNLNKNSKSTATKGKTKYGNEEVTKAKKVKVSEKNNAKHEVELRREEIVKEKTVSTNGDNISSEEKIKTSTKNSTNNQTIKNVIDKNNKIGIMSAKTLPNKKVQNITQKIIGKQTLSERFSSKVRTKGIIKNSKNPQSKVDNRRKSRNNLGKEPYIDNHIDEPIVNNSSKTGSKTTLNSKDERQTRKSKSKKEFNSHNVQINVFYKNKGNDCENDKSKNVNVEKNKEKNNFNNRKALSNEKLKPITINTKSHQNIQKNNKTRFLNNQILRRSLSVNKVGNNEIKHQSKIPQKGSGVGKKTNTALRISPRKLQSISKRVQRQTHIPRLLNKPAVKPTV